MHTYQYTLYICIYTYAYVYRVQGLEQQVRRLEHERDEVRTLNTLKLAPSFSLPLSSQSRAEVQGLVTFCLFQRARNRLSLL